MCTIRGRVQVLLLVNFYSTQIMLFIGRKWNSHTTKIFQPADKIKVSLEHNLRRVVENGEREQPDGGGMPKAAAGNAFPKVVHPLPNFRGA